MQLLFSFSHFVFMDGVAHKNVVEAINFGNFGVNIFPTLVALSKILTVYNKFVMKSS